MAKVCIAIDKWKLAIFARNLALAGYAYEQGPGLTDATLHLYVEGDPATMEPVVRAANNEAARSKMN